MGIEMGNRMMKLPAIGIAAFGWVATRVARYDFLDDNGLPVGYDPDGSNGDARRTPDQSR